MRRLLFLLIALTIAVAGPGRTEADIRIGLATPLTGPYALSGHRNRVAVEMAVHDLNRRGGVLGEQVQLVTADDACGLEQAQVAARALITAGVRFVVGHMCSHASLLAAGLYETSDIPMISPDSTHPRLTEEGRLNVFRLLGRDDRQARLAAELLSRRWAGMNIAILHDGSTYGEGLAAETRRQLRLRGVSETLYDFYLPGRQDYSALLERIGKEHIDVLYIGGYGRDVGSILRTAREHGHHLQLVGGDGLGMDGFWAAAGSAGNGTIFSAATEVEPTEEVAELLARFQRRGLGSRSGGIRAYAAVQVWAEAVERAGSLDLAAVATELRRGRFESVLGLVTFDDKGDLQDAGWRWKLWRNGTHVTILPRRGIATPQAKRRPRDLLAAVVLAPRALSIPAARCGVSTGPLLPLSGHGRGSPGRLNRRHVACAVQDAGAGAAVRSPRATRARGPGRGPGAGSRSRARSSTAG